MKNKYLKNSRILDTQFRVILKEFCFDSSATEVAQRTGHNRKTINRLYNLFRERILVLTEVENVFDGEVEVDESYFGPRRVRGKRGRGAGDKVPVVGLLKRGGNVYTKIVKGCSKKELMPVIKGKVLESSDVYTDGWTSYDGLVLNGYKHYRIHHSKDEFADGKRHINGIESFWSYAKRRMRKHNGIHKHKLVLHLKESEFRWNNRGGKMYSRLLKEFRNNPL